MSDDARHGSDDAGGEAPVFAVVGRINKGKSSIVSTLAEDESVRVDRVPGTTRECQRLHVRVEGRVLLTIVDTPGFEDAPRVLRRLQDQEGSAASRPAVVEAFVRKFKDSGEFAEECRLLEPVLGGAGILYVVDASKPYRPNYEAEMEILQWTGRPRMALINAIGNADHVEEWRRALDQYFSLVRVFDAHNSVFEDRLALLRAFRELREDSRLAIGRAIADLEADWDRRRRRAAGVISDLLVDAVSYYEDHALGDDEEVGDRADRWLETLYEALRDRERRERTAIEDLYRHERIERHESELARPVFDEDLFAETGWRVLGLSAWQLVRAGALAGAAVGGAVDLSVGGTSFLTGTVIGSLVGGVTSYLGGRRIAQVKILGQRMGGKVARVGPVQNDNFPWIVFDRALLHYRSIIVRPHARREALVLEHEATGVSGRGPVAALDDATRYRFGGLFTEMRDAVDAVPRDVRDRLEDEVLKILELD